MSAQPTKVLNYFQYILCGIKIVFVLPNLYFNFKFHCEHLPINILYRNPSVIHLNATSTMKKQLNHEILACHYHQWVNQWRPLKTLNSASGENMRWTLLLDPYKNMCSLANINTPVQYCHVRQWRMCGILRPLLRLGWTEEEYIVLNKIAKTVLQTDSCYCREGGLSLHGLCMS